MEDLAGRISGMMGGFWASQCRDHRKILAKNVVQMWVTVGEGG
jgi:hypothetical protein